MNLESIIQIFSTGGALIAAIFTAVAAFQAKKSNEIALKEIKQNRRVKMNIPNKNFQHAFTMDFRKDFEVESDQRPDHKEKSKFYLKIRNIGNLPAENVQISFEYKGLENFIRSYSRENAYEGYGGDLFHAYNKDGKSYIEFYPHPNGSSTTFEFSSHKDYYGCLMPYNYSDSSFNIHLPLLYIYLINMKAIYEDINLFDLIIKLKFDDPNKKGYIIQKFSLEPEIYVGEQYNDVPHTDDPIFNYYFRHNGRFILKEN